MLAKTDNLQKEGALRLLFVDYRFWRVNSDGLFKLGDVLGIFVGGELGAAFGRGIVIFSIT
ncbi:MAG: hypothetical protein ACK53E_00685, partial [Pseudanabaena sp.]